MCVIHQMHSIQIHITTLTPNIATLILSAASADVRRIIMHKVIAKTSCNNRNMAKLPHYYSKRVNRVNYIEFLCKEKSPFLAFVIIISRPPPIGFNSYVVYLLALMGELYDMSIDDISICWIVAADK